MKMYNSVFQNRKKLQANPVNAAILKDIESAIFFQVIGDETPKVNENYIRSVFLSSVSHYSVCIYSIGFMYFML